MSLSARTTGFVALLFGMLLIPAYGATVSVNCDKGDKIQNALATLDLLGPNTVQVSGTCNEYLKIQGFDRLTLQGTPTARINGSSTGSTNGIEIVDSRRVTVLRFTVNGGGVGVFCGGQSSCGLSENTVQGASFAGVAIFQASSLTSTNDVVQNNLNGVVLQTDSYFDTTGTVIQNNTADGIAVHLNSSAVMVAVKITGNAGNGVRVDQNSSVRIGAGAVPGPNFITNNAGNGVFIGDLSFARFTLENTITGNLTQPDVECHPQYSATRGALTNIGGGTTNCTEPAR